MLVAIWGRTIPFDYLVEDPAMLARRLATLALLASPACHSHAHAGQSEPAPAASATSLSSSAVPVPTSISSSAPSAASSTSAPIPTVTTDWCLPGLNALAEDVCYILPPLPPDRPRRLLVYLHGIVPPIPDSPQQNKVEMVVLHACTRAGVAALIPRGRRGFGPAGARDWWAWPTSASVAPSLVARWAEAKRALEAIADAPFDRTYLAGSSSGAYLLTALAERGDVPSPAFPVDGFAAISGGAVGAGAADRFARGSPRSFYVGYGTYDETTTAGVRALIAALEAAHWPVRAAPHPLGHGTNEVYLDEAFAFFDSEDATAAARR
jgi:predicted esterase